MEEWFTVRCGSSPGWKALSAWQGTELGKQRPHPQGNLSSPGPSSLEITSRPQLCFRSRPSKAAKPGGQCQDQLRWLKTPHPVTDLSVETTTLKGHTRRSDEYSVEALPWDLPYDSHLLEREKPQGKGHCALSLWGAAPAIPFSVFFPHFFLHRHMSLWVAGSSSQANPLNLSPKPPLLQLPSELRQPHLSYPVASSMLGPSLSYCPQL